MRKKEEKQKRCRETIQKEIEFLIDSLDFEPINFNEILCRLHYLMHLA